MTIRVLPTLLVNQIAAGEVVDRPASIVKELVENAIDAGSTRIEIQLDHGGKDGIRVSDNGGGIAPEELELAITPHATSKISEEADLASIASLGFRGEAMYSISAVSKVELITRSVDEKVGLNINILEGNVGVISPAAANVGTKVAVLNLFTNFPARKKFLRSQKSEAGRIATLVKR